MAFLTKTASLDATKKTSGVIPTKRAKLENKLICKDLPNCMNELIKQNEFPNELKAPGITSTLIKQDPSNKENYRPVSVLPKMSKILERVLFDELIKFENKFLFPLFCGFRKGYGTQYAPSIYFKRGKYVLMNQTRLLVPY